MIETRSGMCVAGSKGAPIARNLRGHFLLFWSCVFARLRLIVRAVFEKSSQRITTAILAKRGGRCCESPSTGKRCGNETVPRVLIHVSGSHAVQQATYAVVASAVPRGFARLKAQPDFKKLQTAAKWRVRICTTPRNVYFPGTRFDVDCAYTMPPPAGSRGGGRRGHGHGHGRQRQRRRRCAAPSSWSTTASAARRGT